MIDQPARRNPTRPKTPHVAALGAAKKHGQAEARRWLTDAPVAAIIAVAGCEMEYGETLDDLRREGFDVPASSDCDYSWGFFKQIRGYAHHKMFRGTPTHTRSHSGTDPVTSSQRLKS